MRDVLVILIVLGCSAMAIRRPFFGLMAYVCFGVLSPHSFAWGFARTFPVAQVVALATLLGFAISNESKRIPFRIETIVVLVLWACFANSTLIAQGGEALWMKEEAQAGFIYFSKILLMWILAIVMVTTQDRLMTFMKVIALSLGFFAAKGGIFAIVTGGSELIYGPVKSYLHANNAIGLGMAMNVPLLYYLQKFEEKVWLRRVMQGMIVLSYPAVICTFSRGAWLGLVAATGLVVIKHRYRVPLMFVGCVGFMVGLLFLTTSFVPDRVAARFDDLRNYETEKSAVSRFYNWEFCRRVGFANPLSGEGFNFYHRGAYYKYYPEFIARYGDQKVWSCHSMWFTILAEHGVLAFVLWVALVASVLLSLRGIRTYGKQVYGKHTFFVAFADMLQAVFVVYMIVGTFLDTAYFELFYSMIAAVIILKELKRREEMNTVVHQHERNEGLSRGRFDLRRRHAHAFRRISS